MKIYCQYSALVDPRTLKPNPKNPNDHEIADAKEIMKLIAFYGWRHPIIVSNQSGFIATGHLRHMGALMEELETVPVSFQDFDSPDIEYGFVVADNATQEWSKLNKQKINDEVPNLELPDISYLGIQDFCLDPSELPAPRSKKPKMCPHCGENVNAPPV